MSEHNPTGDIEQHNAWVDDLLADIESQPLRDFIERLKEPDPDQQKGGE